MYPIELKTKCAALIPAGDTYHPGCSVKSDGFKTTHAHASLSTEDLKKGANAVKTGETEKAWSLTSKILRLRTLPIKNKLVSGSSANPTESV